jgi:hypothetical protein
VLSHDVTNNYVPFVRDTEASWSVRGGFSRSDRSEQRLISGGERRIPRYRSWGLRSGDKSLIGNKGYRRYLSGGGPEHFRIDEAKVAEDARYDGKWVLRTNTALDSAEVASQYKQLWMVEQWFRSCKSQLQTRPVYHRCDETIRGHVFCSFLALVLRQELQARLEDRGHECEWADVIQDLDRLQVVEVEQDGKRFLLRSEVQGTCGKVFQTVGVALPPTVQQVSPTTSGEDAAHSATPPG